MGRVTSPRGERLDERAEHTSASRPSQCCMLPPNFLLMSRMTVGFCCVFAAFVAQQNLMPSVLLAAGAGDVGLYSLALLYLVFIFSCLVASDLLVRVSPRRMIPAGAFPYAVYAATGALPALAIRWTDAAKVAAFAALLFGAAGCGWGAAFIWIGQGHVVTHSAPRSLLNRYVSSFFLTMNVSIVLGALLAEQLLRYLGAAIFFLVLGALSASGTLIMVRLGAPTSRSDIPPEPELARQSPKDGSADGKGATLLDRFAQPLNLLWSNPRARRISLLAALQGSTLNCFTSGGLPWFVTARTGGPAALGSPRLVAAANVWLTVGTCLGGGSVGHLADRFGRRMAIVFIGIVYASSTAFCLLEDSKVPYPPDFSVAERADDRAIVPFAHLAALCLGYGNGALQALSKSLIAVNFQDAVKDALALELLSVSVPTVILFILMPQIPPHVLLVLISLFGALAIIAACSHSPLFSESSVAGGAELSSEVLADSLEPGGAESTEVCMPTYESRAGQMEEHAQELSAPQTVEVVPAAASAAVRHGSCKLSL
eukprot:gnl/TRDRNA2_/TRDRNA2_167688_c0_seq1.p1 gnl/TRDRNA2_/TRDRNA2_167688_c0~~gnl/TRDRNA2_/TRDRNA2_167688_c0_seq1.p1  ORF type:complete len:542 (+),score=57.98 gnl/TRDRNA2_/TRDRNA2_167688_c0_seq1:110-1735(+)